MSDQLVTWEIISGNLGYSGMTTPQVARSRHLVLFPYWEARCTCWRDLDHYKRPTFVLASEHVRCHQKDCDLHSGAVARWKAANA